MKTIKRENRIPKEIALRYGGARKFRQRMRMAIAEAQKAMSLYHRRGTGHAHRLWMITAADPTDICDVQVLLDRIARDLSQADWGK